MRGERSPGQQEGGGRLGLPTTTATELSHIEEINKAAAAWITNIWGRTEGVLFIAKYFWQIFISKDFADILATLCTIVLLYNHSVMDIIMKKCHQTVFLTLYWTSKISLVE